ncbi:MAG: hypothetical protein AAFR66_23490 [Bacteroidota bacterium]
MAGIDDFPILDLIEYYVLLRADYHTGIVLDPDLKAVKSVYQEKFSVFKTKQEARKFAEELIRKNNSVECVIYDKQQKVILYLNNENLSSG